MTDHTPIEVPNKQHDFVPAVPTPGQPVVGVPQPLRAGAPLAPPREWSNELCSCCDTPELCCDICWCGYCHLARMMSAVSDGVADDPNWPVCCGICCLTAVFGGIVPCLMQWWMRNEVRKVNNIQGNCCLDCCTVYWCGVCAMTQQHREMTARGITPGVCCCGGVQPRAAGAYGAPAAQYHQQGYSPQGYAQAPQPGYDAQPVKGQDPL
eukprot:TRINITY_DN842_c0_g1_i1.p1 TRINITY_DN842_c0_g1~~TRINITY_DN842_c0_g1_i1.p1  ORF type:complete len:209 (+),score=52.64 TRINITY_DN842_c0_g1_i1:66-692(+)